MGPHVRWGRAPDFAEVAEALGVNTVDVMAYMDSGAVLFTPNPEDEDPMVFMALISRDADGIAVAGPREAVGPSSEFMDLVVGQVFDEREEDLDG